MIPPNLAFQMMCPACGDALEQHAPDALRCAREDLLWGAEGGIWRMLTPTQRRDLKPSVRRYLAIRRAEGWGDEDPEYYRALPFADRSARWPEIWRLRAQSFRHLQRRIVRRCARARGGSLRIVDAGAGNGWLSYRLAKAGHRVAAIDICTDPLDGLGALVRYAPDTSVLTIEASFDHMPIAPDQADLVIFNGTLHYSRDYSRTIRRCLPVLVAGGRIVVMDTPYYRHEADGRTMLEERRAAGHVSDDEPAVRGFLTLERLAQLRDPLGLESRVLRPPAAWRAAAASIRSQVMKRRARASFPLIELRSLAE